MWLVEVVSCNVCNVMLQNICIAHITVLPKVQLAILWLEGF